MKTIKKLFILIVKSLDLGSAIALRLTKISGKSKYPIHPKHLLVQNPWFITYLQQTDLVLDLGCGNGQNAVKAAKIVKKVTGVDGNEKLLQTAKKTADSGRIINTSFEKSDLEKVLKYRDNYFDKVLFLDVLEHLNQREQILKEIRRVLKPKGFMLIGVPNSETTWKKFQRSAGVCSYSDPDHKVEFSEKSILKLLKKSGFQMTHISYSTFDIPARGILDIIGGLSLSIYRVFTNLRREFAKKHPQEASGFEIVAQSDK